ncbi:MAG: 16S rRNA (cytosine(967)-C(5))-methyltransferase RsmB, partial [Oscillospiraceae bacterium]|nr:16S rRNA (cytosine(967)-C(5))-methyltransferase RsmB [Oscillospiraceae bacterium]
MDKARYTAAKALVKQEQDGFSNLVLDAVLKKQDLSAQQKAFCSSIFYGTLERQLTLDARLAPYLKKPVEKLDAPVRALLRSGLYQMLYMDVPSSAAVNEAVKLTRALGKASAAGMVNAVLRRAAQPPETAPAYKSEAERLSVEYSVGMPIVELFMRNYPEKCEEILRASFSRSSTSLRVNTLKTTAEELTKRLEEEGVSV